MLYSFFLIRERRPPSFESNLNFLLANNTYVDLDIEDTFTLKEDVK